MNIKPLLSLALAAAIASPLAVLADDYMIDTKGAHASIKFRVQHLGYSWLYGRFNEFSGAFSYDEAKPEASKVNVEIKTASVDSNHAERDKHIRSDDFLSVEKHPTASFVSSAFKPGKDGQAVLEGKLTLNGVTKDVSIDVTKIGAGKDPWGGERMGFEGTTTFAMADFDIKKNLGPASANVELTLSVEGIKQ